MPASSKGIASEVVFLCEQASTNHCRQITTAQKDWRAMQIVVFIIFFPTSVNRDCLRRAASMRCSARYSQEDWEDQFSWRLRRREGDSHAWWRLSWWRWEGSAPGVLRSTHPQLPSWRLPKVPRDWWESSMRRQQPRQQLRRPRQRRAKKWSPRYHLHYSLLGRGSSSNP